MVQINKYHQLLIIATRQTYFVHKEVLRTKVQLLLNTYLIY